MSNIDVLEERLSQMQVPDEAQIEVYFQLGHDLDGTPHPAEVWIKRGNEKVKVKATKKVDDNGNIVYDEKKQPIFQNFVQTKDGLWIPDEDDDPGELLITGIGSGSVADMDGDVMHKSALESMCEVEDGLATYMEHNMTQDWLLGGLTKSPEMVWKDAGDNGNPNALIKADSPYAAISLESDVETTSPRAMTQYARLKKGRKTGWSIGCFYLDYTPRKDLRTGQIKGVDVFKVGVVEFSNVPMPSQQQSWAEVSRKSFVRKGILPPNEDDEMIYRLRTRDFDQFGPIAGPRLRKLAAHYAKAGILMGYTK